jgi:TolB protein
MRTTTFRKLFFFLLLLSFAQNAIGAERVYLDITASETRKINIAVPSFQNKNPSAQQNTFAGKLANTLSSALEFHGIIAIIDSSGFGGNATGDWKKLGADYAVLGQYEMTADTIKLEMKLLDVAGSEIIMGKSYSGSMTQKEQMLFKFCDSVIETLTGKPGIATSRIAFVNGENNTKEVYLTDILGTSYRQITRHKHLTVSPRFVPGGNLLTYTSYHSGNQNLYITDLRQNKITRVLSRRKGLNLAPAWAADGRSMVLTLSTNGNPDLYLLNAEGEIIEQLTDRAGINVSPSWSPDGSHLVFVSDRSGKPQLYLMEMRTRKVKRLTFEGSENAEPSWSPTEDLIVYSSLRDGVYQLFTLNPYRNIAPVQVTKDLSYHESPSWSPDGNQIIFAKRDGKKNQIYGIMKNGSFQRRLFTLPGSQNYPQWSR